MKKNDLIKKLQAIPGNPHVVVYNGMVDDWMHIQDPCLERLFSANRSTIEGEVLYNMALEKGSFDGVIVDQSEVDKRMRKRDWCLASPYNQNPEHNDSRACILIGLRRRGLSYFDRLGSIGY